MLGIRLLKKYDTLKFENLVFWAKNCRRSRSRGCRSWRSNTLLIDYRNSSSSSKRSGKITPPIPSSWRFRRPWATRKNVAFCKMRKTFIIKKLPWRVEKCLNLEKNGNRQPLFSRKNHLYLCENLKTGLC